MYRKNVASQFLTFQGVDATTGTAKSGVTWTVRRCIDGTFAAGGGTVTEDGTAGWYKYAMSQADTNGNDISFNFTGTGAVPQTVNIVTTACDPTSATNFGITALPATACTTNASLITSGAGTDQLSVSAGKVLLQATQTGVTIPTVTTVTNQLTAAQVATGVWQDAAAGDFTTAGSIGKSLFTSGNAPGAASGLALVGSNMGTVTSVTGSVGSVTGAVGSVTGAVGSVTGNVGGNVTGSVGSVVGNFSSAQLATAWDVPLASHLTAGSTGAALNAAGSAGDPWVTALPGAYAAGSAGYIVGNNLNATVSSRLASASYTTPPTTAQIATAVWTDTTAGDFTTLTSPGKIIFAQLGGAFTTTSSSVYTVAALANAPTGGSAPTTAQIATAVWQDLLAGADFGTVGSIGALLKADVDAAVSSRLAPGGSVGTVTGSVGSVTAGVTVTTNNDKAGYSLAVTPPTAAQVATAVWQDATAGDFTAAGSVGKGLFTGGNAPGAAGGLALVGSNMGSVSGVSGVTFPANFNLFAIDGTGRVTVGTNADKTGYSLTQAFPPNFAALAVTPAGAVTVGTNNDKTGYTASAVMDKSGYNLAATGLDAIAVTDPGAASNHTTLAKMLVAVWRALWCKETMTTAQWKRFANDGTSVNSTSTVSDDGTVQTRGSFS